MHRFIFLLLCIFALALGSITNQEASQLSSGSVSTESKYVNLTFIVKNAPFDGSKYTFFKLPAGYISRPGVGVQGKICAYNEATGACTTGFGNAQNVCFFDNTSSPNLISDLSGCEGNVMNLGNSPVTYPISETIVAVLPPAATFKYEINFLLPPAYPTLEGVVPSGSVFVGDITNSGITTDSNISTVNLPVITPGSDLDTAGWYVKVLSGSNYIFTSSPYPVGSYAAYLDMIVPAAATFSLKTNLFAGDLIVIELPTAQVVKGATCSLFYRTDVININAGTLPEFTSTITAQSAVISFPLPNGLRAQRSSADALRLLCSAGAFKFVPTATELIAKVYLASSTLIPKSVAISIPIANPATPQLIISPMTATVTMSGTSTIQEVANADYVITFPVEHLQKGRIVLSLPANVGWTSATTCTIKYGSSSVSESTVVTMVGTDTVHIDCGQALKVSNTLRCIQYPPFYAQNNIVGTGISVRSLDRSDYPVISASTFTWLAARAGTFTTGTFQLSHPYMGDQPGTADLLLRVPTQQINSTYQIRFTFNRQILVNSGGTTVCTTRDSTKSLSTTFTLAPSLSVDNPHVLTVVFGETVAFPTSYVEVKCTFIQSPGSPLSAFTNVALVTNSDGRVILSKDVTTNAGLMPNFGSNLALVTADPPHTGNIVTIKISLKPVLSGLQYNWNFRPPTNWAPALVSVSNTCTAVFHGNSYTLTYSTAGQEFRVNTTPLRLVISTLDQVDLYCNNFTTPFITTAAAAMSMNFLTDAWVAPSTSPATSLVNWPMITPAITSYKTVLLDKPIVDTITDLTFTLQIEHTKLYSLNGVVKLTFPAQWFLSATAQEYSYAYDGSTWTEQVNTVGGATVCSVYQGSNSLTVTNTVIDTASAQHSIALTIGSSSHLANGNVEIKCSNLKTFRGSVNTHTVQYQYRNSGATLVEETLILLPSLNTGKLAFVYGDAMHSDLKPKKAGTFTFNFSGVEHALQSNEKVCVDLPVDFTMPTTSSAIAMYSSVDVDTLLAMNDEMTLDMAHLSLSATTIAAETTGTSSAAATHTYAITGGSANCQLVRNGLTLASTAYAQRNTTTEVGTGFVDVYTQACVTLTGNNAAQLIPNGLETLQMVCSDVTTHPYAHAARTDLTAYTVTANGDKLDMTVNGTFPEVLPGELPNTSLSHNPGQAGKTGDLTVNFGAITNGLAVGDKIVVRLPVDWTTDSDACAATIGSIVASACESSVVDGYRVLKITSAETVPENASVAVVISNVKPPGYADAARLVQVSTETSRGLTVDRTENAALAEIKPGELGMDVSAVLISTVEANSVANITMLFYPLPNAIPAGGAFTTSFPASPAFPSLHTSFGCDAVAYLDPRVSSIVGGKVVTGKEVYDHPFTYSGAVTVNPVTRTMRFSPSVEIPGDRLLHIKCSFFINAASPAYEQVFFDAQTVDSTGRLITKTTKLSIDSGYPASLSFSVHPPVAALVNVAFHQTPVVVGLDVFGKQASGPAYVSVSLVVNSNDPTTLLVGNTTNVLRDKEASFPQLRVDKVGYGYELAAWCFGTKTDAQSNLFSVWEGTESAKFFWSKFPYIEVQNTDINAQVYVRKAGSMDVDPAVSVPVEVTLHTLDGKDVSHQLVSGKQTITTVDGVAMINVQVSQPGQYYLQAFSTSGYFLTSKTPVFSIVSTAANKDKQQLQEDDEQMRVSISLKNTHEYANTADLELELRTRVCAALPHYFPTASTCGRISTVDINSSTWTIDISESNPAGTRPTANEIAVVLEQLLTDESSMWSIGSPAPSHYTVGMTKTSKSKETEAWIALGVVGGTLGAGVLSIAGTTVYRLFFAVV